MSPKLFPLLSVCFFSLLIVVPFSFSCQAYNQEESEIQQKLRVISREMYEHGNFDFILVEALADSVIFDGVPFLFACRTGHVTFDDSEMPALLQKKYDVTAKDFFARYAPNMAFGKTTGYIDVTLKEVLDPNSKFRLKRASNFVYDAIIVREMIADRLVDRAKKALITYTVDGVAINGKNLPPIF